MFLWKYAYSLFRFSRFACVERQLIILFCSQRSFVDCVKGRQRQTTNSRMIAVNIYAPSSTSTMDTFAIFARYIHHSFYPPAGSCKDSFDNLQIAIRSWNQQHRGISSILLKEKQERTKTREHQVQKKNISSRIHAISLFDSVLYDTASLNLQKAKYLNIAALYKARNGLY